MRRTMQRGMLACVALLAGSLPVTRAAAADTGKPVLLVLAAASLTDVIGDLSAQWTRRSGVPVKLSFAASSLLARQIEAGSRADVFIAADEAWMDYLAARGLVDARSRHDLATNRLVLIAPADRPLTLRLTRGVDLVGALAGGRLATGDPDSVPLGRYARSALESLGAWHSLADRLVRADNARTALMFVARGEAPLGIVYATDARAEARVRVVDVFPASAHPPITYPAAATASARPEARAYLAFLAGPDATLTWKKFGFLETEK